MAKTNQNSKPQKGASAENASAVDSVQTKQELDAAEAKRQAEADLGAAGRAESGASSSTKPHPKVHQSGGSTRTSFLVPF
jgi:hypothetical protein